MSCTFILLRARLQNAKLADDLEEDKGAGHRVDSGEDGRGQLREKQASAAVNAVHLLVSECAEHNRSEEATAAVHAPHVQSVVPPSPSADLDARVADEGGEDTENEGTPRLDESSRRRHRRQTCDRTNAQTNQLR